MIGLKINKNLKELDLFWFFFNKPLDFCHDIYYIYVMTYKKGDDKVSPRTGRPTENPKQNRESFRLSDSDMEKLSLCIEKTGMTKTDVIRKGIDLVYQEITKK